MERPEPRPLSLCHKNTRDRSKGGGEGRGRRKASGRLHETEAGRACDQTCGVPGSFHERPRDEGSHRCISQHSAPEFLHKVMFADIPPEDFTHRWTKTITSILNVYIIVYIKCMLIVYYCNL